MFAPLADDVDDVDDDFPLNTNSGSATDAVAMIRMILLRALAFSVALDFDADRAKKGCSSSLLRSIWKNCPVI